jgi:hypothetical protein
MVILASWIALCTAWGAGLAVPRIATHVRRQAALKRAGWLA